MKSDRHEATLEKDNVIAYYNDLLLICAHPHALAYKNNKLIKGMGDDSDSEENLDYESKDVEKKDSKLKDASEQLKRSVLNELNNEWCYDFYNGNKTFQLDQSSKMILLMHTVVKCKERGEKLLVFSQSLCILQLIEGGLNHIKYERNTHYFKLEGSTPAEERDMMCQRFNSQEKEAR